MSNFEKAREKYKPESIKCLFIAEAPPNEESKRFFYFEDVKTQDSLFWELMKVLYPTIITESRKIKDLRLNKKLYLDKFKENGYYLIDAVKYPISGNETNKIAEIMKNQGKLLEHIKSTTNRDTKIFLISSTVHKANYSYLISNGINIVNEKAIPFPGSGQQKRFREAISPFINKN